jgi:hypothetical protein
MADETLETTETTTPEPATENPQERIAALEQMVDELRLSLQEANFMNEQMQDQVRLQCAAGILASQSGLRTNLDACIAVSVEAADRLTDIFVQRINEAGARYVKAIIERRQGMNPTPEPVVEAEEKPSV